VPVTTEPVHGDIVAIAERQAAARALLAEPLLTERARPEEFALVRVHADWLVQRFEALLGYGLTVDAHFARLAKHTRVPDAAPRSWEPSGSAARGHTYLALILAVLEDAPTVVDVEALQAPVRAAAEEAGIRLGAADRLGERRPFAAAVRRLEEWGVLIAEIAEPEGAAPTARAEGAASVATRRRVDRDLLSHVTARACPTPRPIPPSSSPATRTSRRTPTGSPSTSAAGSWSRPCSTAIPSPKSRPAGWPGISRAAWPTCADSWGARPRSVPKVWHWSRRWRPTPLSSL
jgi:hypothetical protein